jgi:hypothetical protein
MAAASVISQLRGQVQSSPTLCDRTPVATIMWRMITWMAMHQPDSRMPDHMFS